MRQRRDFLKICGLAGLGLAVPFHLARRGRRRRRKQDEPYAGPYYVVFNASGGLGHDVPHGPQGGQRDQPPLQGRRHPDEGSAQVRPEPTSTPKGGMSNEDFYAEFGNELLVLNGLDYSVNNHSPGRPVHGHRQARQPGLPDVRRAGRRMPRARLARSRS